MKNRNTLIDIYKGILIILVVVRHVLQYSVADEGGILTNIIWGIQMPGFMLVSGYLSARIIDSFGNLAKRFMKSLYEYALPFFAWFFLVDVLLLNRFERKLAVAFKYLIYHVDGALWFLWCVFVLSIVFNFINFVLQSKKQRIVKVFVAFALCYTLMLCVAYYCGIKFLGLKYILYYSVFYGAGWGIKQTKNMWKNLYKKYASIIAFFAFLIFTAIVFNFDLYKSQDNISSIVLRCVAGFVGNYALLWVCKQYTPILHRMRIDKVGVYTLELYVTHVRFIGLISKNAEAVFFTISGLQSFFTSLFVTFLFTFIVVAILKSIPITNFIFYGKRNSNGNLRFI